MFKLLRPVKNLIGAGILIVLTGAAIALAKYLPDFWFSFYTVFSRKAMRALGVAFGWIPFPLWEVLLVLLVLSIPVGLVHAIRKKQILGWLTSVLEGACLLVFLFVGLWGLNHFAPPLNEQIGLEVRPYTQTELKKAARWYAEQASADAALAARDENGDVILPSFSEMNKAAHAGFAALGKDCPRLADPVGRAKPLLVSDAFAYMGTTGVFVCLTGEPSVSTSSSALEQPFTICHELSHSLAIAGEDEANYCAYLACRACDTPLFRYSGSYNAFIACYNALYNVNPTASRALWEICSEELIHDCNAAVEHNRRYEGKVQNAAQSVNDSYLKAFSQEGVQSYGLVVDYLIAEYLADQK